MLGALRSALRAPSPNHPRSAPQTSPPPRHHLPLRALAGLCLGGPVASHLPEFGLELVHPPSKPTAVGLQRLLARTASGASEATGLLGERPAAALQSGRQIAKLGQLDLGLALLARGVLGEDVQDHRSTVDRGAAEQLLQLELLGR